MKRFTILFLTIICASYALNGQKYSIGFKPSFLIIGANYTEVPSITGFVPSSRNSYGFGITYRDQINTRIGFKVEPRYIAKGYNLVRTPDDKDIYRNNYLSLPILIDFSPIKNFSLEVGPDISYLLISGKKLSGQQSFQKNSEPNLKPFEFSLVTGVCYTFLERFDFGSRYGFSLTSSEKGTLIIFDWIGTEIEYKFFQNYFEFYLNTRFMTRSK